MSFQVPDFDLHAVRTTICVVGRVSQQNFFLIMTGFAMRMNSAMTAIDLVSKIIMVYGYGFLTRSLSQVFELFFPGNSFVADYILSILHAGWISSGVLPGPTTTTIASRMVG